MKTIHTNTMLVVCEGVENLVFIRYRKYIDDMHLLLPLSAKLPPIDMAIVKMEEAFLPPNFF